MAVSAVVLAADSVACSVLLTAVPAVLAVLSPACVVVSVAELWFKISLNLTEDDRNIDAYLAVLLTALEVDFRAFVISALAASALTAAFALPEYHILTAQLVP